MEQKKWIIYFSILALLLLFVDTARRVGRQMLSGRKRRFDILKTDEDVNLWLKMNVHIWGAMLCRMILPMTLVVYLCDFLGKNNGDLHTFSQTVPLVVLYLLGVLATEKHLQWRDKHLTLKTP